MDTQQEEKSQKTYAVRKGRQPGIYYSWPEAEKQVNGFPGAEYKSFSREAEALNYLKLDPADLQKEAKQEPEYDKNDYSAVIYTGGACRSTGLRKGGHVQDSDKAAWAYMIEHDGQQLADSAGRLGATNNEMEMTAFLESLKKLEQLGLTQQPLLFVLNSQYVIKSVSDTDQGPAWMKSWKKRDWKTANGKPVANQELWQEIDRELAKFDSSKLKFEWLRSTVSNAGSDFVDNLLIKRMAE
ncbi:ribonuclease H family protein [Lactobacillus nasalidis]|uniref:ribonuclease H family protein n=1 Tax=Lactobacillus nasalidis TaxID=2797258 RepID=UPI0027DB2BC2|nr:ribonuclease H family protein [Lactobacillus nasalidis]